MVFPFIGEGEVISLPSPVSVYRAQFIQSIVDHLFGLGIGHERPEMHEHPHYPVEQVYIDLNSVTHAYPPRFRSKFTRGNPPVNSKAKLAGSGTTGSLLRSSP